ncbi:MAG: tRNA (guanosine(37)-N1)-methyltransferase TrmD [Salibacteraceae bacterium]|nr:tRNA (guanosine(37)-N1)-methyltransferase TrmD [Salibacteraceae bacterium]|tara:strand:- start:63564 stop:64244 length:681 start_codon:yes stop_codon:yes gene_type:complete
MRIDIISVVPALLESPLSNSILKRAQEKGLATLQVHDLREYGKGNYRQIDDAQYGGGAGMVIMPEPLAKMIDALSENVNYDEIIFLTPDGETLQQDTSNQLSLKKNLLLVCGHYKGIDERIRQKYVTKEISIGDYVLTGGELPACILIDSIVRLIPGVLNDETSALSDSFQDGLLSPPVYTRPQNWRDMGVPEVLTSGNFKKIEEWRSNEAQKRTKSRRPDLLEKK